MKLYQPDPKDLEPMASSTQNVLIERCMGDIASVFCICQVAILTGAWYCWEVVLSDAALAAVLLCVSRQAGAPLA